MSQENAGHSPTVPVDRLTTYKGTDVSHIEAFQKMAENGWEVSCRAEDYPDMSEEWLAATKWGMRRSKAPFSYGTDRQWNAPSFEALVIIAIQLESQN